MGIRREGSFLRLKSDKIKIPCAADITQGLERLTVAQEVAGSRPAIRPNPPSHESPRLAGRPTHLPAAKEVNMKVIDKLTAIFSLVDNKSEAVY